MNDTVLSMRLVAGKSKDAGFCLSSEIPRAIFRVGQAPECNWRIEGRGIANHHCMMLWNGRFLTLIDVGAGDLWLDNQSFYLTAVVNAGTISFGSAVIVVEPIVRMRAEAPPVETVLVSSLAEVDSG